MYDRYMGETTVRMREREREAHLTFMGRSCRVSLSLARDQIIFVMTGEEILMIKHIF